MLLQYVVIHKAILSSAGINDPIVSRTETENLYRLFRKTNANVILKCNQWSHNAIQDDVLIARRWISNNFLFMFKLYIGEKVNQFQYYFIIWSFWHLFKYCIDFLLEIFYYKPNAFNLYFRDIESCLSCLSL